MNVSFADGGSSSGKPSVAELASFASRAGEIDIGGGGDMVELGDDLGMSLLANPNKVAASPKGFAGAGAGAGAASGRQVSFGGGGGGGGAGEIPTIQIKPVDDLDVVDLNAAPGASDIHINRPPADPAPFVIGGSDAIPLEEVGGAAPGRLSAEEEQREKQRLLTKLRRLDNDGIGGQRMTMQNSLDELKQEHDSRTDSKNLEASVRFQRNALMTFVSGVEMVNDKFGHRLPVNPRLKGWSESVHTNISDFDDIFEELYDLYKDKAKVHPLLRLVGTLGVSATMYHITNTMAERSGIPGMADLMADNPELQRQFAAAAAAKMGGLGNFMSAAGGFPQGGAPPAPPAPMGYGVPPPPAAAPPPAAMSGRGPFNGASGAEEAPRARREMRGPSGVDDILKAFEAERMMDSARNAPPISAASASIFTPSGPPPTPPRGIQILREGVGGPSDPMADFMAAAMDDGGSVGSGSTMNTERRRGRPRKAVATPVGATLNLNV
ncbi:hypothetical protein EBX31_03620 [bacterium]|nr:hypothetical protein [bacterium]